MLARQSTSRHQTTTREKFASSAAIAMIGTASSGPNASISTGISMMEAPKPTMPLSVPDTRPSARIAAQVMDYCSHRPGIGSPFAFAPTIKRPTF